MFDGITIWSEQKDLGAILRDCKELEFTEHTNLTNPNLKTYTADYYGLFFSIHPSGLIRMRGSLHKFYNGGIQNYDDFNIAKLCDTIIHLKDTFNLDPAQAEIHKLEFGFNIILPYNPDGLLDHLISCKGKAFNSKYSTRYREYESLRYFLKLYNKTFLYQSKELLHKLPKECPDNILRIELAISKMAGYAGYKGIPIVLDDLLKRSTWETSLNQLLDVYDQIVMNDVINETLLSTSQRKIYEYGTNPNNWSNKKLTPRARYKKRQLFNPVIENYGQCQYKTVALALMKEKFNELSQGDILTF